MASVFKKSDPKLDAAGEPVLDKNGKPAMHRRAEYSIRFLDEITSVRPTYRTVRGFTDKGESRRLGDTLDRLCELRKAGQPVPAAALDSIPATVRDKLVEWHILDAERLIATRSIAEHLTDWRKALLNKGTGQRQADLVKGRAEYLLTAIRATRLTDVTADRAFQALADLQAGSADKRPVSTRTRNFYAGALCQFMRWAMRNRRIPENPLVGLERVAITDARGRRALDRDEQRWLAAVTGRNQSPVRFGMSGAERALLYRVAIETGYRASEMAALIRASFNLDGNPPIASLPPITTKNKKAAVQALTPGLAAALRPFMAGKLPSARAFRVPPAYDTAGMLRADVADARAVWLAAAPDATEREKREKSDFLRADTDGGRLDFHSLRHTLGTNLARDGASPKRIMDTMRHCDVNLSMRYYAHTVIADRAESLLSATPDLSCSLADLIPSLKSKPDVA